MPADGCWARVDSCGTLQVWTRGPPPKLLVLRFGGGTTGPVLKHATRQALALFYNSIRGKQSRRGLSIRAAARIIRSRRKPRKINGGTAVEQATVALPLHSALAACAASLILATLAHHPTPLLLHPTVDILALLS